MSGYETTYYCHICKKETNHLVIDCNAAASCTRCGAFNFLRKERIAKAVKDIRAKIIGGFFLDGKDLSHLAYECIFAILEKDSNIYEIIKIIEETMND